MAKHRDFLCPLAILYASIMSKAQASNIMYCATRAPFEELELKIISFKSNEKQIKYVIITGNIIQFARKLEKLTFRPCQAEQQVVSSLRN